jgi:hypothetical protein
MNPYRHGIVVTLIGLIVGLAIGVGYSYLTREDAPSAATSEGLGVMELFCTGGQVPKVLVTWPQRATGTIKSLDRQQVGGPWVSIFAAGTEVNPEGYEDTNVVLGVTYRYRLTFVVASLPEIDEISVTEHSCTAGTP